MLVLADTWADAAALIAVVVSLAAVLIVAMLCGWKAWARPSVWERIPGHRQECPRDDTGMRTD
jgi:hypothetical protein